MKKQLFSLLILLLGASIAWANTAVFCPANMTGQPSGTENSTVDNNIWYGDGSNLDATFKIQITGNYGKAFSSQNSVTIESNSVNSFKNSNGAQNTITLPSGYFASSVTFYVTTNTSDDDAKLSEINGTSCNDAVTSHNNGANPTVITKSLNNVNSFTFTFSTKQVFFVAVVTYQQSYTTVYNLATAIAERGSNIEGGTGTLAATTAETDANAPELAVDATSGKLAANGDWAQINGGTVLTLPGVPAGATLTFVLYNSTGLTIGGVEYTNGQTYTATQDGDVVMTCSTGGYIRSITVVGSAFITPAPTYTTVYNLATAIAARGSNIEGGTGTLAATTAETDANAPELAVDATSGKLAANGDWAQINEGTVLTLPGVPAGATLTFVLYNSTGLTIGGVEYTNGQTYTATQDGDVVMTCSTGGYIRSITVVGAPFVTASEPAGYTNTWQFGKGNGAEMFALQKSAEYTYTVSGHSLVINTDAGKLNNEGRNDKWSQCNNGTLFKIPTFTGAKVSWEGYNSGSTTGFTVDGQLYNTYYIATEDGTTHFTATGISYLSHITVEPVAMYEITGTISGGDINGHTITLTANGNGQVYTATVAENAFTLNVPAGTYSTGLGSDVAYVIGSPASVTVSAAGSIGAVTLITAAEQTVTGTIVNAPAEAFTLTFTGSNHVETLNCEAGATSYTKDLQPDTYVISSTIGTLSPLSVESFSVVNAAVSHNIYFPETAAPAATSADITVDNTLEAETANHYKTITRALQAVKAGSISSPVITLTSGQTYREQVVIDIANVTLKTSGEEKATITFYYGIGYAYYSLNDNGYYDRDRAMTRNTIKMIDPSRWGCTVLVKNTGNGFKAENIIFENSFNQYYTTEEVADGVRPNGAQAITYDRTLNPGDEGYKAADTRTVTERAAAIAFENNPTGCQLYKCIFRGSQDTFYSSGTIYVKDCDIVGNTDYIFGGGYVVFDDCNLVIGGYSDQEVSAYITAYNGEARYIFRDCTVKPYGRTYTKANLGRDWGGAAASVYYFNLKNEISDKMSYTWSNMGGGISAGTADLHIYDFDPAVNANYSTTGSSGANINGLVTDENALALYTGVVTGLAFTPDHVYDIPLDENSYYNALRIQASHGGEGDITLSRSIAANTWSTIVLPFDLAASDIETVFGTGASVAELTAGSAELLTFSTTLTDNKMHANQPYAIRVASEFTSATVEGVTIANATPTQTVDGWDFTGTYAASTIPAGSYFFSANQLWRAEDATNAIKPFRAYFTYSGSLSAPQMRFIINAQETTTGLWDGSEGWRDVQKGEALKFVENGRLLILRDGIIYDATGRIVKK